MPTPMRKARNRSKRRIALIHNDYTGSFYITTAKRNAQHFLGRVGNTQVAFEFADMLTKLGFAVETFDVSQSVSDSAQPAHSKADKVLDTTTKL